MRIQEAEIAVRFVGGIETKADSKTVPTSRLLALENGIFTKALSIAKRHGYDALSKLVLGSADTYDSDEEIRGLGARVDELLLFTDRRCYSYIEGSSRWSDAGSVESISQSDRVLVKTTSAQTLGDYAACNGIGLSAWEDSRGGVYYAVVEDDIGRVILGPTQASATATRPRCVRVGDRLFLLWVEAALGQIKAIVFDPATPHEYNTTVFPATLITDLVVATPNFDAAYSSNLSAGFICWNATGGIRVGVLDPSGVIGSPVTGWASPTTLTPGAAVAAGPTLAVHPVAFNYVGVVWATAADVEGQMLLYEDSNPDQWADEGTLGISIAGIGVLACAFATTTNSVGTLWVWAEERVAPIRNSIVHRIEWIVATGAFDDGEHRGSTLASRGFSTVVGATNCGAYVTLLHDVPIFGVYLTVRSDGFVVARTLPGTVSETPVRPHLPSVIDDGAGVLRWVAGYKTILEGINDDVFTEDGLRLVRLDFADPASHQTAVSGKTIYLGGAAQSMYDGQGWLESNFHYGPDWEVGAVIHTNAIGTGSISNGTRNYVFGYEYTLANGEILRGPISKPYQVIIAGANNETELTPPTCRHTRMDAAVGLNRESARLVAWRTVDGDTSSYYRITSLDPSTVGDPNGYAKNDATVDEVAILDQMSDADLLTQEPLYSNGGVLENDPAPSTAIVAIGKGRLWTTDPSDGSTVHYSQVRVDGEVFQSPAGLSISVDPTGGDVTGIAFLDDAVVIFKRSAIFVVAGPGPRANPEAGGSGDGFSDPQLVTTDVGCVSQRSIATTPVGLVFESAKGIYLLDRQLQASYVGAAVEAYNEQAVSRATLVDDTTQVRFLTASGRTLLFDYAVGAWSTWTNHEGVDAVVVGGVYHYLRNDGRVFAEDATGYDDAGAQIRLAIETAWIHFTESLQGTELYRHLNLLGEWKSPHYLHVQAAVDYATPGDWQWVTLPEGIDARDMGGSDYGEGNYGEGNYGGTSNDPYRFRLHVRKKGSAIRFRIWDSEEAGVAGASFELTEGLLEGGIMRRGAKLRAERMS